MADKPQKLWGGRFAKSTDKAVEEFTASVHFDSRLFEQDIRGSIAHAKMLGKCGIIPQADSEKIVKGLQELLSDYRQGLVTFDPSAEDVHMNVEKLLSAKIGEPAGRLHTARSRNDQVVTDLRLYTRKALERIASGLESFMDAVLDKAAEHVDTIIPGMTHLQHAQPVSLAHHLLAYFEMALRDRERVSQVMERVNVMPLGSAALAGTPHGIDRLSTAYDLGFTAVARNSIDAVSDRDFALEATFLCAVIMMHLSRLAEEIVIWNSQPFSFVELPDAYCTGSSIMPQKKNPDVAELVRGKTGTVYGDLVALLTMMKGLPLAYNRDMQEDKGPLFRSLDTTCACLDVMAGLVRGMEPNGPGIERSLKEGFITATDLADYLASRGMPFRDAHRVTGEIVSHCLRTSKVFSDLTLEDLKAFSPLFEPGVFEVIDPRVSVDRRTSMGGTARPNVRAALDEARAILEGIRRGA